MAIQVELTPEQEAYVAEKAEYEGLTVGELLAETAAYVYSEDRRQREVLRERIAKADRGEFLSDGEAQARFTKILPR